jgi:nicotinic acid mononucleotide adenylyltransferase
MDGQRKTGKKKMRFKDFIKESIIDIPRKNYATGVFDNADTNNPKLKEKVRQQVLDGIKTFEKFGKVVKYTLIGSILTKQYRKDADLDINILFDIPGSQAEQEKVHEKIREYQGTINGKTIPGTDHPINFFSIIDPATFTKAREMADGTFDIDANKFIKRPEPSTFEPEKYVADFQRRVAEIDVVKGELQRDMIDYEELKELSPKDIEGLEKLVSKKLAEITDSIKTLIDIGDKTTQDRKDAFLNDMSPDEIRKFGTKNRLPKNVIYKMLEKYHYLKFFKHLKDIMQDGKVTPDELKSLSKLKEAKGRHIAFTFGRFNPPTIGHEKLLNKLASVRADNYFVFLSRSEDSDKNPLSYRLKVATMKRMFPRHARSIVVSPSNRVFDIATDLYDKGVTEITMVVGSDRVREFETLLKKYNDVKSRHGYYDFDRINIVSAGERDPDAEGATGMSASKMRAAARKDDFESFKKGLPSSFARSTAAQDLFKNLKRGMNLAASVNPDAGAGALRFKPFITASTKEDLDNMLLRDKYLTEHLYDIGDIVDDVSNSITGIIIRRGTNYVTLEDANMKLHKAWLYDIIETPVYPIELEERARELRYDKETDQPKKYVKGLSDKEKKAHDRHLEKQSKKSDSDPSAYQQSPADKVAKTKPSKYTKRFKQMYGELAIKKDKEETEKMNMGIHMGMPEAYDIGHDYALANAKITPGEPQYDSNFKGTTYKPSKPEDNNKQVSDRKISSMITPVDLKDIEEWVNREETKDKYKERYGEEWQSKLDETYDKMVHKLVDRNDNIVESRIKEYARDLIHLNSEQFKSKHGKLKEEVRKEIGESIQVKTFKEFQELDEKCDECIFEHEQEGIMESEYQGKKVKLNDPFRTSGGPKKFSVYVKNEKGNVVKVNFGDPNMEIKRDDPDRRRNFRARHNCDNPGPKWKARYWSCYQWRAGSKVEN